MKTAKKPVKKESKKKVQRRTRSVAGMSTQTFLENTFLEKVQAASPEITLRLGSGAIHTDALQYWASKLQDPNTEPGDVLLIERSILETHAITSKYAELVKKRVREIVEKHGQRIPGKQSMSLTCGLYSQEIRPCGGGLDSKLLVPLLNDKGMPLIHGMDPTVTYKPNKDKLESLVAGGQLTREELAKCSKPKGWAVQKLRVAGAVGSADEQDGRVLEFGGDIDEGGES